MVLRELPVSCPRSWRRCLAATASLVCLILIAIPGLFLPIHAQGAETGDAGAPDVAAMAAELAALRGDVEGLAQELEAEKEAQRAELRALAAQRSDQALTERRESLRREQLTEALNARHAAIAAQSSGDAALVVPLMEAIVELAAVVEAGLPYRTSERRTSLAELEVALSQGLMTPPQVTSRLWQFIEDELKLSRENAIDRQIITLEGREQLVEVARLGMVSLYFRTEEGRVGYAERGAEGWRFRVVTEAADERAVDALFEAMKKQIRTGYFEIPNALAGDPS